MSFQNGKFPAGQEDAAQRNAKRDSLFLGAIVRVKGQSGQIDVRVRNLSAGGLLAEAKRCPVQGAEITIELRKVGEIPARVMWSGEGRFGVAFDTPIDPQDVRTPVGKGAVARDPVLRPMYPTTGRSPMRS
jgi:PilZ domain